MTVTRKYLLIHISLVLAVFVMLAVAYHHLPPQVAAHWHKPHQPDKTIYISRQTLLWKGNPGLWAMAGVLLLTYLWPWLSPNQFEMDSFRSTYLRIMTTTLFLAAYMSAIFLWSAFGHKPHIGRPIWGGIFLIAILNGNLLGKVRRNFFVGIKTPWTLTSERVWNATHRFAAKIAVAGGLAGLAVVLIGPHRWNMYAFCIFIAGALVPRAYSLVLYKQLERRGEL
jgi:uncharacterized membrane protein